MSQTKAQNSAPRPLGEEDLAQLEKFLADAKNLGSDDGKGSVVPPATTADNKGILPLQPQEPKEKEKVLEANLGHFPPPALDKKPAERKTNEQTI